ncbi:MAG: AAA family ATPase [Candidatus Gracilibacteria bacterium]
MQIQIKNIGTIKEANVNLDGLSVIAGGNDSGKSTVSKIVFSVIKAFQRYKYDFNISKEQILEEKINDLYRNIRFRIFKDREKGNDVSLNKILKEDFYPPIFLNELSVFGGVDIFKIKEEKINTLLLDLKDKKLLIKLLIIIKEEFLKDEKKEDLIKIALDNILKSEFENQLNNEKLGKKGTIELRESNIILFKIIIEKNKVSEVQINDDILKIKDTTFIDSPMTLNLYNYLNNRRIIPGIRNKELQFHIKDLFSKIGESKFDEEKTNKIIASIENIVKGVFKIVKKGYKEYLVFSKNGIELDTINTATGIKSFGLLDLLDKANSLESDDLLILDEPEVHLHPEWQVRYAELIVTLIKERGLSVLITSHSPYMIEALSKFSKNEDKVKASFYLAEESKKGGFDINNKTNKKYEIFEKLSKPFRDLMLK